jgi:5-hydroxyisourate hydrolase
MIGISTHVLDLSLGRPAFGILVRLERERDGLWQRISQQQTDEDGRIRNLQADVVLESGRYRLGFETGPYFRAQGTNCFHPYIEIAFEVTDLAQNYHVPLLVTPHSYSTYRGS